MFEQYPFLMVPLILAVVVSYDLAKIAFRQTARRRKHDVE